MNVLRPSPHPFTSAPECGQYSQTNPQGWVGGLPQPHTPPPFGKNTMTGRKRKAEDELEGGDGGTDQISSGSPSVRRGRIHRPLIESLQMVDIQSQAANQASSPISNKRARTAVYGRPLTLPRLLQTMGLVEMQKTVATLCSKHPELAGEFADLAPAPSVQSVLGALQKYEYALSEAFPYGTQTTDYAFNRVRPQLTDLLEALEDFTPHFLPPREQQTTLSLSFLDGATTIIHRIPDFDSAQNNHHKDMAYEEMAKAWAVVIKEAKSRGGGIQITYGGWHEKLAQHNQRSGGKLAAAVQELQRSVDWVGGPGPSSTSGQSLPNQDEMALLRQQLLSGTYGSSQEMTVTR